jgi:general secretion pathway protein G
MRGASLKRRGLRLVKFLLVLVIAVFALAIVIPSGGVDRKKARINVAKVDISEMTTQLRSFKTSHGRVPTTEEGLGELVTDKANLPNWSKLLDWVPVDPWGRPYHYSAPGKNGIDFDLYSTGPSGVDGNADNIRSN